MAYAEFTLIEGDRGDIETLLYPLMEDDYLEVYVWLEGRAVRCDYGVPGSPMWTEIEDVGIVSIEVNGVSYPFKAFESAWGKDIADHVYEMAWGRADEGVEWT